MPEDILTYKVELDTSDVSSQLEQLKGMIDAESGSMLATAPMLQPTQMPALTAPNFDFGAMPTIPDFSANIPSIDTVLPMDNQQVSQFIDRTVGAFDNASSMVGSIVRNPAFSTMHDLGIPRNLDPGITGESVYNAINKRVASSTPLGALFEGSFGFDYDPRLPMSESEYKKAFKGRYDSKVTEEWLGSAIGTLGGMGLGQAIGTAAGALVPIPGVNIATSILGGFVGDKLIDPFLPDYEQEALTSLRTNFIQGSSFRTAGGSLSRGESAQMANRLGQWQDSGYAYTEKMDTAELDTIMRTFTAAGGFDNTSTVEEYKRTMDTMVSNARNVMQTLHKSTTEAAEFMGQMSKMGVTDQVSMGMVTGLLGDAPHKMGLTSSEALQLGTSAVGMVQGTSIAQGSAFMGALGTTELVHSMVNSGILDKNTVNNAGGVANVGLGMYQQAINYGMSKDGFLSTTAMWAGGGNAGYLGNAITAAGAINSPEDYYSALSARESIISNSDPLELLMMKAEKYASIAGMAGMDLDPGQMKQLMIQQGGMSNIEAETLVGVMQMDQSDIDSYTSKYSPNVMELASRSRGITLPRVIGRGIAKVTDVVAENTVFSAAAITGNFINGVFVNPFLSAAGKEMIPMGTSRQYKDALYSGMQNATGTVIGVAAEAINRTVEDIGELYSGKYSIETMGSHYSESFKDAIGLTDEKLDEARKRLSGKNIDTSGRRIASVISSVAPSLSMVAHIGANIEIATQDGKDMEDFTLRDYDAAEESTRKEYEKLIKNATSGIAKQDRNIFRAYLKDAEGGSMEALAALDKLGYGDQARKVLSSDVVAERVAITEGMRDKFADQLITQLNQENDRRLKAGGDRIQFDEETVRKAATKGTYDGKFEIARGGGLAQLSSVDLESMVSDINKGEQVNSALSRASNFSTKLRAVDDSTREGRKDLKALKEDTDLVIADATSRAADALERIEKSGRAQQGNGLFS